MKKLLLFSTLLFTLSFSGCKKDQQASNPNPLSDLDLWLSNLNVDGLNAEALRVFNDVQNIDYHYGIIANSNAGTLFSFYGPEPYFSGLFPEFTSISLNGINFTQDPENHIMLDPNFDASTLNQFFGAELNIEIAIGNDSWSFERYSPEILQAPKITTNSWIDSTSTLTWNVDHNSPVQKVIIMYEKSNLNFSDYESDMLVVDNTGSFNLNQILDPECKELSISILQGNTCSFTHKNKKHLFSIYSIDHHKYAMGD